MAMRILPSAGFFALRRPLAGKSAFNSRPATTRLRSRISGRRRLFRVIATTVIILFLIPILTLPLYRGINPVSTVMLLTWATGGSVDRRWVDLDAVAPVLIRTVISSEDGRYCAHAGVDWSAISDVLDDAEGPSRGASTITMQTVKNLFLWPSRSYLRKFIEMPFAYYADIILGKKRTLEIYLNVAEWGPGIFGVEAAARRYFGRSAASLDARQSALLAAALPNPALRDPGRPSRRMANLARILASRADTAAADTSCLRRQRK